MSARWAGIDPAQAVVRCDGHDHTVRWEAGRLIAVDHDDPEAEATLAALAGTSPECLALLRAWARRRADPRVLGLASRGPADAVDVDPDRTRHLVTTPGRRHSQAELLQLLALGGGLPDRLQAETTAIWARRLRTGHRDLADVAPQLQAALYGRALAALRTWLGEPALAIELEMVDEDAPRGLVRTADGITLSLPFAWLSEVWARGLAIVFGTLCLGAESVDGRHWSLSVVGPDLIGTRTITITL